MLNSLRFVANAMENTELWFGTYLPPKGINEYADHLETLFMNRAVVRYARYEYRLT